MRSQRRHAICLCVLLSDETMGYSLPFGTEINLMNTLATKNATTKYLSAVQRLSNLGMSCSKVKCYIMYRCILVHHTHTEITRLIWRGMRQASLVAWIGRGLESTPPIFSVCVYSSSWYGVVPHTISWRLTHLIASWSTRLARAESEC